MRCHGYSRDPSVREAPPPGQQPRQQHRPAPRASPLPSVIVSDRQACVSQHLRGWRRMSPAASCAR